ncbi:hypothetical protein BGX38DRAFT_1206153 [Terfezia claveryi]|nr:hypothetical protein BGX38DRAFT_1206153 [Terfezia claveryi]
MMLKDLVRPLYHCNVPFTQQFIDGTLNLTSGGAYYEVIPERHWELPEWVDQDRFMNSLEYLGSVGVGKSWLHPRLLEFDYYWRVEPNVRNFQFSCIWLEHLS